MSFVDFMKKPSLFLLHAQEIHEQPISPFKQKSVTNKEKLQKIQAKLRKIPFVSHEFGLFLSVAAAVAVEETFERHTRNPQ